MKIKVINPPNAPFSSKGILIEPIDVLGVASFIASLGHDVTLVDMDIKKMEAARYTEALGGDTAYDFAIIVYDYHIPLHCDGVLDAVREIAVQARAHGARVVVGGKMATYKPQALLTSSAVDILIRHEMEPALVPLLAGAAAKDIAGVSFLDDTGAMITTPRKAHTYDIETLPIPDRSLLNLNDYIDVRTMLSSRGCHMKCDFCHVPGFWGGWRGRSAGAVVDEIEYLVGDCAAKKILFLDDNTIVSKKRMQEICKGVTERGIKTTMGCLGSLSLFDEQTMEMMYEAGFRWIHYGVESGDDALLQSIHKKIAREDVKRIINKSRDIGFRVRTSWILDLPGTTADQLARTTELILELRTEEIRLHHLAIRMGSSFYESYGDIPSTQYIHQGKQNQNLSATAAEAVAEAAQMITRELGGGGYAVVTNPDEFIDMNAISSRSPDLNVVSLCPLRYGIGWRQ